MTEERELLLHTMQYVHIIDNNTGRVRLVEGPHAGSLQAHEQVHGGIRRKVFLRPYQDVIVKNPFRGASIQSGEREIRRGPQMFALHPGEEIEGGIRQAIVKTKDSGVYIRNTRTGKVRLEIGPKRIFLKLDEELYHKQLTEVERRALYVPDFQAQHEAVTVDLQKDDIIQLYDKENSRIEKGPKRVFLGPYERPKLFSLSGGTPKRPDVVTRSKISTSPSFISDILSIRTKDNAILKLRVRYKQQIIVTDGDLKRIFSINDFVGFAVETLASEIREEAAKYDFEEFHSNATGIVKQAIFPDSKDSREFENGLEIFGVDIKEITPQDDEIAKKLNSAISKNMDIYVDKILQEAELEAKRELVEGEKEIEELRQSLIELKNENDRKQQVGSARIRAEATSIRNKGDSDSEALLREASKDAQLDLIRSRQEVMNLPGSERYLRLQEYLQLGSISKKLVLPTADEYSLPSSGEGTSESANGK